MTKLPRRIFLNWIPSSEKENCHWKLNSQQESSHLLNSSSYPEPFCIKPFCMQMSITPFSSTLKKCEMSSRAIKGTTNCIETSFTVFTIFVLWSELPILDFVRVHALQTTASVTSSSIVLTVKKHLKTVITAVAWLCSGWRTNVTVIFLPLNYPNCDMHNMTSWFHFFFIVLKERSAAFCGLQLRWPLPFVEPTPLMYEKHLMKNYVSALDNQFSKFSLFPPLRKKENIICDSGSSRRTNQLRVT